MKKVLVVAFNISIHQQTGKNSCVLDILPEDKLNRLINTQAWGSILMYDKKTWLESCSDWKPLNKAEFEALYGEIRYP